MIKKSLSLFCFIFGFSMLSQAESKNRILNSYTQSTNPATSIFSNEGTSGIAEIKQSYYSQPDMGLVWDGKRGEFTDININGIHRTSDNSFWRGGAGYKRGTRFDTQWSNTAQSEIFYPYLVGDSIGGNYKSETYWLGGGYGKRFNRSTLAGDFTYSGSVSWRNSDPRPKNTNADLALKLGYLYESRIGIFGLSAGYQNYKQHLNINIEEDYRKDKFYLMLGMGLYDRRYSTLESSYSRYYRGNAWEIGFSYFQKENAGFFAEANYKSSRFQVEESDFRISAKANTNNLNLLAGYLQQVCGQYSIDYLAGVSLSKRTGTENAYKNEVSNDQTGATVPVLISSNSPFRLTQGYYFLQTRLRNKDENRLFKQANVLIGMQTENETYEELYARYTNFISSIGGEFCFPINQRVVFETDLSLAYRMNLNKALHHDSSDEVVSGLLVPNFEYKSRSVLSENIEVRCRIQTKDIDWIPFVSCNLRQSNNQKKAYTLYAGLRLNI